MACPGSSGIVKCSLLKGHRVRDISRCEGVTLRHPLWLACSVRSWCELLLDELVALRFDHAAVLAGGAVAVVRLAALWHKQCKGWLANVTAVRRTACQVIRPSYFDPAPSRRAAWARSPLTRALRDGTGSPMPVVRRKTPRSCSGPTNSL